MMYMSRLLTTGLKRPSSYIPNGRLFLRQGITHIKLFQPVNLYYPTFSQYRFSYRFYTSFSGSKLYNNQITLYRRQFSTQKPTKSLFLRLVGAVVTFPLKFARFLINVILKPFKLLFKITTGFFKIFSNSLRLIGKGINRCLRVAKAARQSGVVGLTRSIWNGIVHTFHWCKTGFKLYAANVRVSYFIMLKKLKGHQLGYKEHKLLMRTLNDCFKLVPFSLFLIVPFAEFLLPVAIKLFPNMLPSTFRQQGGDTSYLHKKLLVKKQLAEFFQELVQNHTNSLLQAELDSSIRSNAEALSAFQQRLLDKNDKDMNPFLTVNELVVFSKLLRHEFVLDKMDLKTLRVMCELLGIRPFSLHSHVVLQLRHHLLKIQREDQMIRWEGVESLSTEELSEACRDRAMKFYDISKEQMQQNLNLWLDLSCRKEIPLILLLWSRCITMTHSPMNIKEEGETQDVEESEETHCKEEDEIIEREHQLEELLITEANLRESIEEDTTLAEQVGEEEGESEATSELNKSDLIFKLNQLDEALKLQKTISEKQEKTLKEILTFLLKVSESNDNEIGDLKTQATSLLLETNESISQIEELISLSNKEDKPVSDTTINQAFQQ